jgi:hypothetical protein
MSRFSKNIFAEKVREKAGNFCSHCCYERAKCNRDIGFARKSLIFKENWKIIAENSYHYTDPDVLLRFFKHDVIIFKNVLPKKLHTVLCP